MSTLEFIDSLVRSLAWPIAAVVLALVLRGRIAAAIDRITGIEGFGVKAAFEAKSSSVKEDVQDQLAEAEFEAAEETRIPEDVVVQPGGRSGEQDDTSPREDVEDGVSSREKRLGRLQMMIGRYLARLETVEQSLTDGVRGPSLAVFAAWDCLEYVLRGALDAAFPELKLKSEAELSVAWHLYTRGVIPDQTFRSIRELEKLRTAVAGRSHPGVGREGALAFIQSAEGIIRIVSLEVRQHLDQEADQGAGRTA